MLDPTTSTRTCGMCKQLLPLDAFHRNKKDPLGRCHRCKSCISAYMKDRGYNHRPHRKRTGKTKAQKWLDEYKETNPCSQCGESCAACLDLHHIDPGTKDRSFRGLAIMAQKAGVDRVKREVEKCVVLCANCHRKVHAGVIDLARERSLPNF